MKKWWMILAGVIIVILVGVGIWIATHQKPEEVPVEPSGETKVSLAAEARVETIESHDRADSRWVDVKYPSLQSFRNKDFQKYVNDNITKVINAYKDEIAVVVDDETPKAANYYYITTYDKFCHGDYLSLVINNDYQTGGIRSNKWKDIYNINVRTERLLTLGDIFPATVNYEKEILNEILKQAEERHYELMNGEGLDDLNDNQKFFIKDEKLVIYFDPGEIAPATYGALEFVMPYVLNEEGRFEV